MQEQAQKRRQNAASAWTEHLKGNPKAQHEFKELVMSTPVLARLRQLIKKGDDVDDRREVTEKFFESANWQNKMAYQLGKRAERASILRLITFQDQGQ